MNTPKRKPGRPPNGRTKPVEPTPTALAPEDMGRDGLANLKDAAVFLGGVHVDTVRNLVKSGKLPRHKDSYRVLIPWAALRVYAAQTNGT